MEARDITFPEETHTWLSSSRCNVASHFTIDLLFEMQNPHPLQKKIVLRVSLSNNTDDSLRDKISIVIDTLISEYNKISNAVKITIW